MFRLVETGFRPVEPPQTFTKVDLLPIDNDSEKIKVAKQI